MNIEQARYGDIAPLADALGNEEFFYERFERQKDGKGILFIAWLAGEPVGDVYLWLEPAEEYYVRKYLAGVPLLTHLEVLPQFRNRGIGTKLIDAVETYLLELGQDRVALAVRLNNVAAVRLYQRLGYANWGHGAQVCFAETRTADGHPAVEPELCYVMVKQLHSMSPSPESTFSSLAG